MADLNTIDEKLGHLIRRHKHLATGQVLIVAANVAVQLPSRVIPLGRTVVIKALPGNLIGGTVRIAGTRADAENASVGYPLVVNEGVALAVENLDILWMSGATVAVGITWIV